MRVMCYNLAIAPLTLPPFSIVNFSSYYFASSDPGLASPVGFPYKRPAAALSENEYVY